METQNRLPIIVLTLAVMAVVLAGAGYYFWSSRQDTERLSEVSPSPSPDGFPSDFVPAVSSEVQIFQGTLPCADCEGIRTVLTLDPAPDGQMGSRYQMTQTYLGKSVAPLETTGFWLERGSQLFSNSTFSPPRTLIVLDMGTQTQTLFLINDDTSITQLDADGNLIDAGPGINFTLTRVSQTSSQTDEADFSAVGQDVNTFVVPADKAVPIPTPPPPTP